MRTKKIVCIIISLFILNLTFSCFASDFNNNNHLISYSSASSLKYKLNSLNKQIRKNEYQIKRIKRSTSLSKSEKRSKINRLEYKNRQLKRKIAKIKSEYKKAIS